MPKSKLELKAEVFSLFQTISMLNAQYRQGNLQDQFYVRKMNTYIQDLNRVKRQLRDAAINYERLVADLDLDQNYTEILKSIHEFQLMQQKQRESPTLDYQPLALANQIQTITSHFITLSDYLYLVEVFELELLFDLIRQLLVALHHYDFFSDIFNEVVAWERKIQELITHNQIPQPRIPELRNKFSSIFENYRDKLESNC